ncbi:hypothetical protein A0H76_1643 [Hepatospora eriocheir]|uniref:Uncharacterized protein n=1 Tax=Hepatospora eriocheir TaxID=1081669 RepID=A0A1X0Q5P7_9MICR|nr:hypothetical protein A0H76_1643 [Hepatospora eriocheir]
MNAFGNKENEFSGYLNQMLITILNFLKEKSELKDNLRKLLKVKNCLTILKNIIILIILTVFTMKKFV